MKKIITLIMLIFVSINIFSLEKVKTQEILLEVKDNGFVLLIPRNYGTGSILLTNQPHSSSQISYGLRNANYHPEHIYQRRILDGKVLDNEYSGLYLADSEVEYISGKPYFRFFIEKKIYWGFPNLDNGVINIRPGATINIRSFEKRFCDYSGRLVDQPYTFKFIQPQQEVVPTEEPAPEPQQEVAPTEEPAPEPQQEVAPTEEPAPEPQQEVAPTEEPAPEPQQEVAPTEESAPEPQQEVVPTEEPAPEPQQEVVPTEEPAPEPQQEVAPTEEPAPEPQQEVAPTEEPAPEPQQEVVPTEEPAPEPQQEVVPTEEPAPEPQQEVAPTEEPAPEPQQEVAPTEEPAPEPQQEVAPTEEPAPEPQQEVAPTEEPVVFSEEATLCAEGLTSELSGVLHKVTKTEQMFNLILDSIVPADDADIVFVVDTTLSMADEFDYFTKNIGRLMLEIEKKVKNPRYGIVFYRDFGSYYVTDVHFFTKNKEKFLEIVQMAVSAGGGDIPEALYEAIYEINRFEFFSDNRYLYILTDAPGQEDSSISFLDAVDTIEYFEMKLFFLLFMEDLQ
ncbi:MAG: VWA domain-containing protein [Spirochaetales bacterium]|nr:VWA domain-containing protein [Spirochaetales bacterium]